MNQYQNHRDQNTNNFTNNQRHCRNKNPEDPKAIAHKELDLRDKACDAFRDTVAVILERCLDKGDMKTALKAQELLARHYGLLPTSTRYRKVRFLKHMLSEHDFRDIMVDIGKYIEQEVGGVDENPDKHEDELSNGSDDCYEPMICDAHEDAVKTPSALVPPVKTVVHANAVSLLEDLRKRYLQPSVDS